MNRVAKRAEGCMVVSGTYTYLSAQGSVKDQSRMYDTSMPFHISWISRTEVQILYRSEIKVNKHRSSMSCVSQPRIRQ